MDDRHGSTRSGGHRSSQNIEGAGSAEFPREVAAVIGIHGRLSPDLAWDAFLDSCGDLLLKTAVFAHRNRANPEDSRDASMDAYAFMLEKLRHHDFQRLRAFKGGDKEALSRWLVVVARRLCTDFWRHRYGRVRPSTPALDIDTRRRLVDEIWDPRDSSELPTPKTSNPEWELRYRERRKALEVVLDGLEPQDQLLMAFRFEEGLPARKIADLMDFPSPFHVYRHLNRVLKVMRERLEAMGVDEADP